MPGGLMIPGRNMPTAAAMIGGLASYAASLGQVPLSLCTSCLSVLHLQFAAVHVRTDHSVVIRQLPVCVHSALISPGQFFHASSSCLCIVDESWPGFPFHESVLFNVKNLFLNLPFHFFY
jgi:hypothetical protein